MAGLQCPDEAEECSDSEAEEEEKSKEEKSKPVVIPEPNESGVYDEEALAPSANEAHAVKTLEVIQDIKGDIENLEKESQAPVQHESLIQSDPLSPFRERESHAGEDSEPVPRVVGDILKIAGLRAFNPKASDSQDDALQRIRSLCPLIRTFVAKVRVHEALLSKAIIHGKVGQKCGRHHRLEHLLARLRRKYSLQGVRQSRFTAWAYFSQVVSDKAIATTGNPDAAEQLKMFVPSCHASNGARAYQIIAVRLHIVGMPQLALVEEVFRGSHRNGGRRSGKKLCEHPVDSQHAAVIRAVLLEPVPDAAGEFMFTCTCLSPAVVLNLQDEEGPILWNVPRSEYEIEETPVKLIVRVKKDAVLALSSVHGTGVIPAFKGKVDSDKPTTQVSYTPESFRNRKNVLQYVDVMKSLLYKILVLIFSVSFHSSYIIIEYMNIL